MLKSVPVFSVHCVLIIRSCSQYCKYALNFKNHGNARITKTNEMLQPDIKIRESSGFGLHICRRIQTNGCTKTKFYINSHCLLKISDFCCGIIDLLEPRNIFVGCSVSTQLPCLFLVCLLSFVLSAVLSNTRICVFLLFFFVSHAVKPGY